MTRHFSAPSLNLRLETLLVAGLVAAALLVRWPELFMSPPFPAVGNSVIEAMAIAGGDALPVADQAPYLGAPFLYLLAAAYKLFGASVEVTLLVPWAIGGLTVIPAYLLGREVGGRLAGLVGAALLVTSPAHTVITSHVPWVHSMTPLLAVTTLWLLARAVLRRDRCSLILAGLAAGLSLQTHPTVLPLLATAAAVAMAISVRGLSGRTALLFGLCATIGYSTLLMYHVQTRFAVIADVRAKQARYLDADVDPGEHSDRGSYLNNLEQLSASLARLASGELSEGSSATTFLGDPRVMVYPALGALGLLAGKRRIGWFLLAGVAAGVLLPPMFNGKYKPVLDGRYLMPLVPVLFVGVGILASRLTGWLRCSRLGIGGAGVAMVALGALVLAPLFSLSRFYEESSENGASNARYIRTLRMVESMSQIGDSVWLDPRLRDVKSPGGGNAGSSFGWLLAVSDRKVQEWRPDTVTQGPPPAGSLFIVHRATSERLRHELAMAPIDESSASRDDASYRLVRVGSQVARQDRPPS